MIIPHSWDGLRLVGVILLHQKLNENLIYVLKKQNNIKK